MTPEEKARLLIECIRGELALGTRHFRRDTGEEITTLLAILQALKDDVLMFEPVPERQEEFRKTIAYMQALNN